MKIIYYVPNSVLPAGTPSGVAIAFRSWAMQQLQAKFPTAEITVTQNPRYDQQESESFRSDGFGIDAYKAGEFIYALWDRFTAAERPARCKCPTCDQWSDV